MLTIGEEVLVDEVTVTVVGAAVEMLDEVEVELVDVSLELVDVVPALDEVAVWLVEVLLARLDVALSPRAMVEAPEDDEEDLCSNAVFAVGAVEAADEEEPDDAEALELAPDWVTHFLSWRKWGNPSWPSIGVRVNVQSSVTGPFGLRAE